MFANRKMLTFSIITEFKHICKNGNSLSCVNRFQNIKRYFHSIRACIIAIINQCTAVKLMNLLAHRGIFISKKSSLNNISRKSASLSYCKSGKSIFNIMFTKGRNFYFFGFILTYESKYSIHTINTNILGTIVAILAKSKCNRLKILFTIESNKKLIITIQEKCAILREITCYLKFLRHNIFS